MCQSLFIIVSKSQIIWYFQSEREFRALNFRYPAYRYKDKQVVLDTEQRRYDIIVNINGIRDVFHNLKKYSIFSLDNGNSIS